jgi:hypothetical protein
MTRISREVEKKTDGYLKMETVPDKRGRMKFSTAARVIFLVLGTNAALRGAVVPDDLEGDEWVAGNSKAADEEFAEWKATGKEPEDFKGHAIRGERADLIERMLSGDRLPETEIKVESPPVKVAVTVRDLTPAVSDAGGNGPSCETVWRRITKDRFEIWTPKEGKLFEAGGKRVANAKVHRGDGWGREWYGAFLPDGSWVTTDLDERDDRLTMFSAKGKRLWSIKGATLVPKKNDDDLPSELPLIAWARSAGDGKVWVVSVGSEFGRGWVKVTPDGKWSGISCPWKECLPQQLGPRGMYTAKVITSDDGSLSISRMEPSHGPMVGWPVYQFPEEKNAMIPDGGKFGILAEAWAVFIEGHRDSLDAGPEERQQERLWFFDAKGNFQHWIKGRGVGANLTSGDLWVRLQDDSCVRVDKGFAVGQHLTFTAEDRKPLIPVELHEDIGLGLFLREDQLAVGTWNPKQ